MAECVGVAQVWGYELAVPPPPSSGATVILALHILSGKVRTPHPPHPHLTLSTCLQFVMSVCEAVADMSGSTASAAIKHEEHQSL